MVALKLLPDELEDFQHELTFIEIESFQQNDDKLDETVNKSIVQSVVIGSSPTFSGVKCKVYAMLDHLMCEGIQHFLILIDSKCAKVAEIIIHFLFLCSRVVDVRKFHPFLV